MEMISNGMKLDFKDLPAKLRPALDFLKQYIKLIFVVFILIIFGFFVFRINQYSNTEPSETAIEEKLQTVQRPKIDQAIIDKIEQLKGQNIQVQSLFDQARNNPFSE